VAMMDRMVAEGFLRSEHRRDLWHGEDMDMLMDWMRARVPSQQDTTRKHRS
jgi:hypothetical protein